jgi:hypothetical protein
MKIRINFFAEPPEPNGKPSVIACPTGDFASLEEARPIALADGNKPAIMAHSIVIESLDDASLSEQWIRDRDGSEKHRCLEAPKAAPARLHNAPIKRWQMRPTFLRQVSAASVAR